MHPGRLLIFFGVLMAMVGCWLLWGPKLPWIGRLPGDIHIEKDHFSFDFPFTSCLLLSLLVSLLFWFFRR